MRGVVCAVMMTGLLIAAGSRSRVWAATGQAAAPTGGADPALALKINDALRVDHYLDYRDMRADAKDGRAVLMGTVLTDFEKTRAAKVAGGVPGVKGVTNRIVVVQGGEPSINESDLARRVREGLAWDPTLHITDLTIETQLTDTIVLHGIVSSTGLKARIGKEASSVKGVGRVVNDLHVEPVV